jgi:hypothetical protein
MEDVEKAVGTADVILGPIPTPEELRKDLRSLEESMAKEKEELEEITELAKKDRLAKLIDEGKGAE